MDKTTDAIREDLDATRDAMTDKLGQIESRVKDHVDGTVDSVKHVFDIGEHVNQRPWVALGASFLAGCVLAGLDAPSRPRTRETWRGNQWPANGNGRNGAQGFDAGTMVSQASSVVADVGHQVADRFGDEIDLVKAAAIATLVGLARDWFKDAMPAFGAQFDRVLAERGGRVAAVPAMRPADSRRAVNGTGGL